MHLNLVRWESVRVLRRIEVQPLLALWEKKTNPAQQRLEAYLDRIDAEFRSAASDAPHVGVAVDVHLEDRIDILRSHDVENYLTPIAQRLRLPNLVLAAGTKQHGLPAASSVSLLEVASHDAATDEGWLTFRVASTSDSTAWKEQVRDLVARAFPAPIAAGPVALELIMACNASRRNWVSLWKPLGDCLGPALGQGSSARQFDIADGRITQIAMHRTASAVLGNDVVAAVRCRGLGGSPDHRNV